MAKKAKPSGPGGDDPGAVPPPGDVPRPEAMQQIEKYAQEIRTAARAVEPFFGKLTPEQVDRILANADAQTQRLLAHADAESQRQTAAQKFGLLLLAAGVLIGLVAICFLWTVSLSFDKPELVSDLVKMIGGLIGGLLGGYGLRGAVEGKPKPKPRI